MDRIKIHRVHKSKHCKWGLSRLAWLVIGLAIITGICFGCNTNTDEPTSTNQSEELEAVIIDQLYTVQPDQGFIEQVTQELEDYGFNVSVYQEKEVTVNLYRRLPLEDYKLIIFRAHSGTLTSSIMGDIVTTGRIYLFTDEPYVSTRYTREQLTNEVLRAKATEDSPEVFAIGAKFISNSMQGRFPRTIVIMMGCTTTYSADLAQAFLDRGASIFLGWDGPVDLDYVDEATLVLINKLCQDMTMEEAVAGVMTEIGPDPEYNAYLKYYPVEKDNKTINELIQ